MPDPIEIVIRVRDDGTLKTFDGATKRILEFRTSVEEAATTLSHIKLYESLDKGVNKMRTSVEEAQATLANTNVYEQLEKNERRAAAAAEQLAQAKQRTRTAVMAFSSSVNVLQNALGDQLPPSAKKAFDGLGVVTSAAMIGSSILPGLGTAVGVVAGGMLALGSAAMSVDPKIQALNDQLDKMARQDETTRTLAEIGHLSEGVAEKYVTLAQNNRAAAVELQKFAQANQPMNQIQATAGLMGKSFEMVGNAIMNAGQSMGEFVEKSGPIGDLAVKILTLRSTMAFLRGDADAARDALDQMSSAWSPGAAERAQVAYRDIGNNVSFQ